MSDGDKSKIGRPSGFEELDLARVEQLATRGWTDVEMAEFFGVTVTTWHNWKKAHPAFFDSLKDWKLFADERVERSLYERACGYAMPDVHFSTYEGEVTQTEYVKHVAPDTVACIFWLKNRQPKRWRDKIEFRDTGDEDAEKADLLDELVASATDEELEVLNALASRALGGAEAAERAESQD